MGISGEAVMVSSLNVPGESAVLILLATGRGVVVVHLRIRSGWTAIGSQAFPPAAETHHCLGHISGSLCAYLPGADNMCVGRFVLNRLSG